MQPPRSRQKTSEQFKEDFNANIYNVVNEIFNTSFTIDTAFDLVKFYDTLKQTEKKKVWDKMTVKMPDSTRLILYKYFNNTFKAAASPKWPENLLSSFAECAKEQARLLAADFSIDEEKAIRVGVEKVKQMMRVREYQDFHQETAHHKIRNALLPEFKKQRELLLKQGNFQKKMVENTNLGYEQQNPQSQQLNYQNFQQPQQPQSQSQYYGKFEEPFAFEGQIPFIPNQEQLEQLNQIDMFNEFQPIQEVMFSTPNYGLKLSSSIYDQPADQICFECPEFNPFDDQDEGDFNLL